LSLALGRAIAARDSKELWQLIREMAKDTMAGFVAANSSGAAKDVAALKALRLEEVMEEFTDAAQDAIKEGEDIYELLREQLPVYQV